MSEKALGVVIPVYNEGANIGRTLTEIRDRVRTPHRIYLVYDFEQDDTLPAARPFREAGQDIVFVRNLRGGVVHAIRTGLREAAQPFVLVTMADLSDDYGAVDPMIARMREGYDIVCGSRYMQGGRQIGGSLPKKTLSRLAGWTLRHLAGLPTADVTNSFKLYRREMLQSLSIDSDGGFEIGMEIVVKAHFAGFRVTEIPCIWRDREQGTSRFRILRWAPKYLRWYVFALKKRWLPPEGP